MRSRNNNNRIGIIELIKDLFWFFWNFFKKCFEIKNKNQNLYCIRIHYDLYE